jgi:hypothetical protein
LDYLKIDAEGAEAAVLEGARECIRWFRPIVQVEVIVNATSLDGSYRRFGVPGGMNHLFIPAENLVAIARATQLGWVEIKASATV